MTTGNIKLSSLITSYIVTNDSSELSRIPPQEFEASKYFIKVKWDYLKSWAPEYINNIMWNIENKYLNLNLKNKNIIKCTLEEKDYFLGKISTKLFRGLALLFESNRTFGKTIPTDLDSYLTLQEPFDFALTVLWGKIYPTLANSGILPIKEPEKIRQWMSDQKNENLLNTIVRLDLSKCKIKSIPHEIKFLKKLESLHLEHNEIEDIHSLFSLLKLKRLYLSHNLIRTIPNIFGEFSDLELLCLNNNRIKKIPTNFSYPSNLRHFNLSHNEITDIPDSLCFLVDLEELFFEHNRITTIPDSIGNLSGLVTLHLNNNEITKLPYSLGLLIDLEELFLEHNRITTIPDSIGNLSGLVTLHLNYNEIITVPNSLGNLSELITLYLSQNKIEKIPTCLFNLESLEELALDRNKIKIVPNAISRLSNLEWLSLHNNCFTEFPNAICNLRHLNGVSLHNNMISEIPRDIEKLKRLQSLHIENNQISILPSYLFKPFTQLEFIYIDGNPLLFNFSPLSNSAQELRAKLETFNKYACESMLSNLFQLIGNGENFFVIKNIFSHINTVDQKLIFEMILRKSEDHPLKEDQIFDNIDLFYVGVRNAILEKFARLPQDTKEKIYTEIYRLTDPITDDDRWGEHHVFDHILLLIDVMNRAN